MIHNTLYNAIEDIIKISFYNLVTVEGHQNSILYCYNYVCIKVLYGIMTV